MITDSQTYFLFLVDCLPSKQPKFFQRFEKVLADCNIKFQFLPHTKDIWAIDFMPVQISKDKFVQFTYNPDYLQPKKEKKTISDVDSICNAIHLTTQKSKLIIDGGDISKAAEVIIKDIKSSRNFRKKEIAFTLTSSKQHIQKAANSTECPMI